MDYYIYAQGSPGYKDNLTCSGGTVVAERIGRKFIHSSKKSKRLLNLEKP